MVSNVPGLSTLQILGALPPPRAKYWQLKMSADSYKGPLGSEIALSCEPLLYNDVYLSIF